MPGPNRPSGPPRNRRELRRAIRHPAPGAGNRPSRRPPPEAMMFFYAIVFLVLTVIVGVAAGAVVLAHDTAHDLALGVGLLLFAAVAAVAIWLLRRRGDIGYWLTVAVLSCAGGGAMAAAAAAGSVALAVLLCPPLVVAVAMTRPSTRAAILRGKGEAPAGTVKR